MKFLVMAQQTIFSLQGQRFVSRMYLRAALLISAAGRKFVTRQAAPTEKMQQGIFSPHLNMQMVRTTAHNSAEAFQLQPRGLMTSLSHLNKSPGVQPSYS